MRAAAPLPETAACDRAFRAVAAQGPAAGLAALYAYESMVPAVAASKTEAKSEKKAGKASKAASKLGGALRRRKKKTEE